MGYYYKNNIYAGVDKFTDGMWSFGIGLNHSREETYIHISFYIWHIYIGVYYELEVRR